MTQVTTIDVPGTPCGQPFNKWMDGSLVINNHFLCEDWEKIIQLKKPTIYLNAGPWGSQVHIFQRGLVQPTSNSMGVFFGSVGNFNP